MEISITASSKDRTFLDLSTEQWKNILDYCNKGTVEVDTVEQLLDICRKTGCSIVLSAHQWVDKEGVIQEDPDIEIYNYFVE